MKHNPNCDVNDINPDGIKKPCNCDPACERDRIGSGELIRWLQTQIMEDDYAMIHARESGEWNRYRRLAGHRGGMLDVLHYVRAQRASPGASRPGQQEEMRALEG